MAEVLNSRPSKFGVFSFTNGYKIVFSPNNFCIAYMCYICLCVGKIAISYVLYMQYILCALYKSLYMFYIHHPYTYFALIWSIGLYLSIIYNLFYVCLFAYFRMYIGAFLNGVWSNISANYACFFTLKRVVCSLHLLWSSYNNSIYYICICLSPFS